MLKDKTKEFRELDDKQIVCYSIKSAKKQHEIIQRVAFQFISTFVFGDNEIQFLNVLVITRFYYAFRVSDNKESSQVENHIYFWIERIEEDSNSI